MRSVAAPIPDFASPTEYLQFVLAAYQRPWEGVVPDPEWMRLTGERLSKLGSQLGIEHGTAMVVASLSEDVAASFRRRHGIDIIASCAIGVLDDPTVNARCFRSPGGHYAIVLHRGIMNLLHKHTKLLTAAVDPSHVMYCNRAEPSQLTSEVLVSWADELGEIYKTYGVTKGAMVMLDDQATFSAGLVLSLAETFIVGHEVGHMVAGHLEDSARLSKDRPAEWLAFYAENERHADEFEADAYGFETMLDSYGGSLPDGLAISALVATFNALNLVGAGKPSATHPAARERIHRIVAAHFDTRTTELVHRWIDEGDNAAATEVLLADRGAGPPDAKSGLRRRAALTSPLVDSQERGRGGSPPDRCRPRT